MKHLFTSQAVVVQGKFLQQRADVVENLLKAQVEAIAFSLAPKNKPTVIKTFMRRVRVDAAAAENGYADLHRAMDRKPYPSPEGLLNVQRLMALRSPKVGELKSITSLTTASFAGSMKAASSTKLTQCKAQARSNSSKVFALCCERSADSECPEGIEL